MREIFWKTAKGDNSVYLIGTINPGKSNINYLNNTMGKVLKETDVLALEINFSNKDVQNKIEELNKEKDIYLVSIGVMHFFGNDNIIKKLEDMGYIVIEPKN